jgi:uncharacterized protein YeaO (DUF488 family)/nitrite reductase/ring-hydroxylating ferredoxin subunit
LRFRLDLAPPRGLPFCGVKSRCKTSWSLSGAPSAKAVRVDAGGTPEAVIIVAGKPYAIGALCPQEDGPLEKGEVADGRVAGPSNASVFEPQTRKVLAPSAHAGRPRLWGLDEGALLDGHPPGPDPVVGEISIRALYPATAPMSVQTKRAYEPPAPADGRRYLIDRLWPRGIRKRDLLFDEWFKDLAPSPELRTWFGHDPSKYPAFRRRYRAEIAKHPDLLDRLVREARSGTVTLLFAAHDVEHCNASVLRELLDERLRG